MAFARLASSRLLFREQVSPRDLAALVALVVLVVVTSQTVAPKPAEAVTCSGVIVREGSSIQRAISSKPQGTTFCILGTHKLSAPLKPKYGQRFIGSPGAVIAGGSSVASGFTNSAAKVTVRGLVIKGFDNGIRAGRGWTIVGNTLGPNRQTGVRLSTGNVLRNNYVHHNALGGVFGAGDNILVESNEIAYNHLRAGPCTGKFVYTRNLVIRGNYAHHNSCPTLWTDINNYGILFERNIAEDNNGAGIDIEIGYNAVVRYNTIRRNTKGIQVSSTPNVKVYGNTVVNNSKTGILVTQQGENNGSYGIRSDHPSPYGPHKTKNNVVYNNRITLQRGTKSGVTRYGEGTAIVFDRTNNNHFENNDYRVPTTSAKWFEWKDSPRTWSGWRSFGHDDTGSYQRL